MGFLTAPTVKNLNFTNPRWRTAAILKTVKSPYICNRLTDFHEIWHDEAYWPRTAERPLKFRIFENSRWRQPPSGKSQKIVISPQRFDRFLLNLVRWCKMGLLTAPAVKKIRISQIQDGGRPPFLRTVTSSYLSKLLTDFYEIWRGDACWSPEPGVNFKFFIFDNLIRQIAAN